MPKQRPDEETELRADLAVLAMRAEVMGWPSLQRFLVAAQSVINVESRLNEQQRKSLASALGKATEDLAVSINKLVVEREEREREQRTKH